MGKDSGYRAAMIKKISGKLRSFLLFGPGALVRRFLPRRMPANAGNKIFVHIGCGDQDDAGYVNIDARAGWHIHKVGTIEEVRRVLGDNRADLIYCCHIIEHVSHQKLLSTLVGVRAALKQGGILRLSVPDFSVIARMYEARHSVEDVISPLMGGQGYADNFHRSVFDKEYLTGLLLKSGFSLVRPWDPAEIDGWKFDDWASRTFPLYGIQWKISLNLEAVK